MRIGRLLSAVSTAAVVLAGSADAQARRGAAPTGRDAADRLRAAVVASAARTGDAFNRGEIEGFIRPYSDEVWVFPPNAEPFQGRDAALQYFSRSYGAGLRNLRLTTTGLDRSGEMAYETGTYTADVPGPAGQGGAMSRDFGKYVQVWKRTGPNGAWEIHFAMWNSNLQPTAMPR
jgi:ketosteroid isomerase-like protein